MNILYFHVKKKNPVGSFHELLLHDHGLFVNLGWISLEFYESLLYIYIYILFGILKILFQLANQNEYLKYLC